MALVCMMMVSCNKDGDNGKHQGHEYVDLGLPSGLKWATCNVGAKSPEEFGHYFAWGETETKNEYTKENSSTYDISMSDISGNAQYDAATANWGGNWRIPTYDEFEELINNCQWVWLTKNGVKGYNIEGPNGNSIFLPAAGYRSGTSFNDVKEGYYWTSTPYEKKYDWSEFGFDYVEYVYNAYEFDFESWGFGFEDEYRSFGNSVRPVLE